METKELMIGDWVKNCYGEKKRVEQILSSRVMLAYNDVYYIGGIEPIPLTEKILKKNGFSKLDNIGTYFHGILEDSRYYEIEINLINNMLWINRMWFKANNIHYVHELQHALRMCKIEKEIEL